MDFEFWLGCIYDYKTQQSGVFPKRNSLDGYCSCVEWSAIFSSQIVLYYLLYYEIEKRG